MAALRRLMTDFRRLVVWWRDQTARVKSRGWRAFVFVSPVLVLCVMLLCVATAIGPQPETTPTPVTVAVRATQAEVMVSPTQPPQSTSTPQPPEKLSLAETPPPVDTLAPTETPTTAVESSTETPTPVPTAAEEPSNLPAGAVSAQLVDVVDGDTIKVSVNGISEDLRYIGIDTPESGQPGFGAATDANRALLTPTLYLVPDRSDRDQYGRLLRYVYTDAGLLVNAELVRQGWAQPVEYPPDTRYATEFRQAARQAAAAGVGFWSGSASDGVMPYALTTNGANIRTGPGTTFDIGTTVPADTPLTVFGRTPDGEWLQVRTPDRSGGWVSASLVALAVAARQVEVAKDIPAAPVVAQVDTTRSEAVQVPAAPAAPAAAGGAVRIVQLSPRGDDEYVVIQNTGADPVNLSGWSIQSYGGSTCQPEADQVFWFASGFQLAAGASVRVHSGPSAFGNPPSDLLWTTINNWNNSGDRADLRDAGGQVVSTSAYGNCR